MKLLVAAALCCSLLPALARADTAPGEDAPKAKPKRSLYDLGLGPYFGPAPPPLAYAPAVVGPPPPPVFTKVVAPSPLPAPVFTKVVAPAPLPVPAPVFTKVVAPAPVFTKVLAPLPPPVVTRVTYPLPPVVTKVSYPVPSLLSKLAFHAAPALPYPLPPAPIPVGYAAYAPHYAKVAAPLPYCTAKQKLMESSYQDANITETLFTG